MNVDREAEAALAYVSGIIAGLRKGANLLDEIAWPRTTEEAFFRARARTLPEVTYEIDRDAIEDEATMLTRAIAELEGEGPVAIWLRDVLGSARDRGRLLRAVGTGDEVRLRLGTGPEGEALFPTDEEARARADAERALASAERDEERVDITVVCPGREIELPARSHHYLLVTLARARLATKDARPAEQGWLERDEAQGLLRPTGRGFDFLSDLQSLFLTDGD